MEQTKNIKNIMAKIFAIQQEIEPIVKDGKNDYYHSRYVTLSSLLSILRPIFKKYNIVFVQTPSGTSIDTYLYDLESEECLTGKLDFVGLTDMQKVGIGVTYARRYSLIAMLGLSEKDDDGNGTLPEPPKPQKSRDRIKDPIEYAFRNFASFVNHLKKAGVNEREYDKMSMIYQGLLLHNPPLSDKQKVWMESEWVKYEAKCEEIGKEEASELEGRI